MLGVIGGTVFAGENIFGDDWSEVNTPVGRVIVFEGDGLIFLPRHGQHSQIPAHKIDHRVNIAALKKMRVERVVGVCSCGSLKRELSVGTLLVPDDYMNFTRIPTFYDEKVLHVTPGLDEDIRGQIIAAAEGCSTEVTCKGVYAQTSGPRLETKAEVRMISQFADVVGMTLASEATLCKEAELPYAGLCSVDNLAHGLAKNQPESDDISEKARENADKIKKIIENIH